MRCFTSFLLTAFAVAPLTALGDPPSTEVGALVTKLGSPKFSERQAATVALDKRGGDALPVLQAALESDDPEVRQRAALLVHKIELRLETAKLLGSKKLRLVYDDVNVLDAVKDLSAKSGFTIDVEGDRLGLRGRTVSLDTGDVPFWEAFDLLCRKAGLRERAAAMNGLAPNPYVLNSGDVLVAPTAYQPAQAQPRIALEDSKTPALPTTYHGALRLRAVPPQVPRGQAVIVRYPPIETPEHVGFILEITPEAKVPWQGIVALSITRAIDEHGQTLLQAESEGPGAANSILAVNPNAKNMGGLDDNLFINSPPTRQAVARLKPGKQPARTLKEVQGRLTVNLTAMRKLVTVDHLLGAAAKEFKADDGTVLKVLEVTAQEKCLVIRVQVGSTEDAAMAGNGVILVKGKNGVLFLDGPGPKAGRQDATFAITAGIDKPAVSIKITQSLVENGKGGIDVQYVLQFPRPAAAAPDLRLTFSAPRLLTTDIPFTLRDVPLVENPRLPARDLEILLTK